MDSFPGGGVVLFAKFFDPGSGSLALNILIRFVGGGGIGVDFEGVIVHENMKNIVNEIEIYLLIKVTINNPLGDIIR